MERESMQFDVVIVGAGPAGLAAAIRLRQLSLERDREISVCVLEKASELGAHTLSGAVLEPRALDELMPDWQAQGRAARRRRSTADRFQLPDRRRARSRCRRRRRCTIAGNYIVSMGNVVQMAGRAGRGSSAPRSTRASPRPRCSTTSDGSVKGVATGAMGLDRDGRAQGQLRARHRAARHLHAVRRGLPRLAHQAARGALRRCARASSRRPTRSASRSSGRSTRRSIGRASSCTRIGWPLDQRTYGGSFLYHLEDHQVAVGFVVGLDYQNPYLSPFEEFQRFKTHPAIRDDLRGRAADLLRRARAERGRPAGDPASSCFRAAR